MNNEEVLDKVKRLLRLAESSNEHEAAAAAAAASALMTKHKIHKAMLDDSEEEEMVTWALDKNKRMSTWKTRLGAALSEAHGVYLIKTLKVGLFITGSESDITMVQCLYSYCKQAIDNLTLVTGKGMGRKWCTDYRHGCVDAIESKLEEAKEAAIQAAFKEAQSDGTSLAVVNQAIAKVESRLSTARDWYRSRNEVAKGKVIRTRLSFAREQGRHDGQSISLESRRDRLPT